MTKKQIEKRRYATEMEIKTIIQHIQLRMGLNRFLAQAQPQFQLNLEVGIFDVFVTKYIVILKKFQDSFAYKNFCKVILTTFFKLHKKILAFLSQILAILCLSSVDLL